MYDAEGNKETLQIKRTPVKDEESYLKWREDNNDMLQKLLEAHQIRRIPCKRTFINWRPEAVHLRRVDCGVVEAPHVQDGRKLLHPQTSRRCASIALRR